MSLSEFLLHKKKIYKHLLNQTSPHTIYFIERSKDGGEPYYPVPNKKNKDLYRRYQAMAALEEDVTFVGRLANYKYFNMDQAIKNALDLFERDTKGVSVVGSLPDWRMNTRCSVYMWDCITHAMNQGLFKEYPFHFTDEDGYKGGDVVVEYEKMAKMPKEWNNQLINPPYADSEIPNMVYPPQVSKEDAEKCISEASDPWKKQLDRLLETRIRRDPDTNMVAYTMSDYRYAFDMIHEVFEMTNNTIGFAGSFFIVAFDRPTVEIACRYGYPVMGWTGSMESTEDKKK